MKCYFVTYQITDGEGSNLSTKIIDIHPLEYNKKLREGNDYSHLYCVVWWTELTKEEYEKYK